MRSVDVGLGVRESGRGRRRKRRRTKQRTCAKGDGPKRLVVNEADKKGMSPGFLFRYDGEAEKAEGRWRGSVKQNEKLELWLRAHPSVMDGWMDE